MADGVAQILAGAPSQAAAPQQRSANFDAANQQMQMTPQEQALYQMHLQNLSGAGGVDNPDGSRSTLYQAVQEHNGKFYNIPTVWGGQRLTEKYTQPQTGKTFDVPNAQALQNVEKAGWETFPSYPTAEQADARYDQMHGFMEKDTSAYFDQKKKPEPSSPTTNLKNIGSDQ